MARPPPPRSPAITTATASTSPSPSELSDRRPGGTRAAESRGTQRHPAPLCAPRIRERRVRVSHGFAVGLAVGVLAHELGGERVGGERGDAARTADRRPLLVLARVVPVGQDFAAAFAACSAPWSPMAFM